MNTIRYPSTDETEELNEPEPSGRDPWKHRSKGMRCATCIFFVVKEAPGPHPPGFIPLGRCRRHAPTMSGYPAVFVDDWCGDHKLDETKI